MSKSSPADWWIGVSSGPSKDCNVLSNMSLSDSVLTNNDTLRERERGNIK